MENITKNMRHSIYQILFITIVLSFCSVPYALSYEVNVASQNNGGVATAINYGTYMGNAQNPWKAIDNDPSTGWSSNWSIPAWLQVEFDQIYSIGSVGIHWGSHTHDYYIEYSADGNSWQTIVGPYESPNEEGESLVYEVFDFNPVSAKFIRIYITTTSAPSGHIFQASVQDIEAYAEVDGGDYNAGYSSGYSAGLSANNPDSPATVSANLDIHIPSATFGSSNIWVDLEYEGASGFDHIWKLSDYGYNQ